jgi:chromate reductase
MAKIIGVAGSLRDGSINAALLRAATQAVPAGHVLDIGTIRGIPLYDGDVEQREGIPEAVKTLKDQIAAGDGLLLVSPEYNGSLPGVFKNAIDWLSRPPKDIPRVFTGRPVGIIGATPGGMGTAFAQTGWLQVVRTLRMKPWFGSPFYLSSAHKVFDESGKMTDEDARKRLTSYLDGFVEFIEAGT